MSLYDFGEILTFVCITMTFNKLCHDNDNSCQYFSIFVQLPINISSI